MPDRGAHPKEPTRFDPLPEWVGPSTRLVHGARRPERNAGAVVPPIYQTTIFHYPGPFSEARETGDVHLYTRLDNPTTEVAEELIRGVEGGAAARVFASGMAAVSATVLSLLRSGDELVALDCLYGGVLDFFRDDLPRFGIRVRSVSLEEAQEPERVMSAETRLAWIETPTNPVLRVHDIRRWAAAADAVGALLVVDNTFASPINQNPLAWGADLVIHSATKYLGGHADLTAGAVVGPTSLIDRIDPRGHFGGTADPFASFLLARSLKTLPLRVARQNESGARVAEALSGHPAVAKVHYPGRASPAEEEIARRQMRGRGGVVSVSLRGGASAVDRFLRHLRLVHVASSLGSVESLASVPGETSHRHLSDSERAERGIDAGLVRLSLGVEDPDDLVRDLRAALDTVD